MKAAMKRTSVPDSIIAAMKRTNQVFETEVVGKRDFGALDRVYTAQARILPPGAPMVEGRDAIKAFWKQAVTGMNVAAATLTIVDAEQAGEDVVEIGRAELTLAGGQKVPVKYVVHWKEQDGGWRWHTDIWNLNQ